MAAPAPLAGYALFPTAIGMCAIGWRGETVVATNLPEGSTAALAARVVERCNGARQCDPPVPVQRAIAAITALLDGQRVDLDFIACDFGAIDPFRVQVYEVTRKIPPGSTRTYGEIAAELGNKRLAQAVGQAMGRNPLPIVVPCHRVMGANGKLTGFSAGGGIATKLRMLEIEGAAGGGQAGLFEDLPLAVKPARSGGPGRRPAGRS